MTAGPAFPQLTPEKLVRSRRAYVDDWLIPMWPKLDWRNVHEFIFWHAIAGWARGSNAAADHALAAGRAGQAAGLGTRSRELWAGIREAIPSLAGCHADPLALLSTPDMLVALTRLDEVKHIGPKIAAFTLRDLTVTLSGRRAPARSSLLFGGPRRQTQFSVLSPTTRPKCLALFVTNVTPNDRA